METVTIERSVLEWLTREALEMRLEGLDMAHECDRVATINVHKAKVAISQPTSLGR